MNPRTPVGVSTGLSKTFARNGSLVGWQTFTIETLVPTLEVGRSALSRTAHMLYMYLLMMEQDMETDGVMRRQVQESDLGQVRPKETPQLVFRIR
jgi:hypothetical protein